MLTAGGTAQLNKFYADYEIKSKFPYAWTRLIEGNIAAQIVVPSIGMSLVVRVVSQVLRIIPPVCS